MITGFDFVVPVAERKSIAQLISGLNRLSSRVHQLLAPKFELETYRSFAKPR
jgi:hypothetical protein